MALGASNAPNVAFGALDAPKAAFGALSATKATLGRLSGLPAGRNCRWSPVAWETGAAQLPGLLPVGDSGFAPLPFVPLPFAGLVAGPFEFAGVFPGLAA